jgi:ribonuclease P protein component
MNTTFSKAERLNSKKIIDKLFEKGSEKTNSVFLYPFRVVYLSDEPEKVEPISIIISVSKRSFKKAVDRNLVKRRIREAYRLNKHFFTLNQSGKLPSSIAWVYVGKEILPFATIEAKLKVILDKICQECM